MAITKDRLGEIALLILQNKMERNDDIVLNPSKVKEMVSNISHKLKISPREAADFAKHVMEVAAAKVAKKLDAITDKVEED